jgi:hypothetical protein
VRRTPRKYRAPAVDQAWPQIILGDPDKYGGPSGLMCRLALVHLRKIEAQPLRNTVSLRSAMREMEVQRVALK